MHPPLILASRSPRRRQLFDALGLSVTIKDVDIDEEDPAPGSDDPSIARVLEKNARTKAEAVLADTPDEAIVIAADTMVAIDGYVLGKPKSRQEAAAMLERLSGREHQVFTGLALVQKGKAPRTSYARSAVKFHPLERVAIDRYVATREPYDKAGSYAVQGLGMLFIEKIEGSYTNVMGLPLELLLVELEAYSGLDRYRWFA